MEMIETKELKFGGILTPTEIVLSLRCPECRKWTPLRKSKCGSCGYVLHTDRDIIRVRDAMKAQFEELWRGIKPTDKVIDNGVQ